MHVVTGWLLKQQLVRYFARKVTNCLCVERNSSLVADGNSSFSTPWLIIVCTVSITWGISVYDTAHVHCSYYHDAFVASRIEG